jgi:RecA-family ATPase
MGLQERAVAWSRHYKRDYGRLAILPVAIMLDDPIMTQIFVEAAMKAQEKLGAPFKLVIIDTMARSFNGDENSAQDAGAFINSCYAWRARLGDCSVMVITHAGKEITRGIRGSSALKAACDFVFVVTRPNHLQALLRNEKQKDIDETEDMRFALQSVHIGIQDHKGRERKSLVPILESKGEMADPDAEDDQPTAFEVGDMMNMIRIVKANTAAGQQMTEDSLRVEFSEMRTAEGAKPEAIRKSFKRNLDRAKEKGYLMKHGKNISIGETKI